MVLYMYAGKRYCRYWGFLVLRGGILCGWKVWGDWCGRNIGSGGSSGSCGRATGWHSWLSAQTAVLIDVVKIIVVPGEIMMVSIDFCRTAARTYRFCLFLILLC